MLRIVAIILFVAAASASGSDAAKAWDSFSGSVASQSKLSAVIKWRIVQTQLADDAARLAACRADAESCNIEHKRLDEIVDRARAREGRSRIGEINRAVNLAIRSMSDLRRFGIQDHWSAPLETLRAGIGDCEDYAILKYLVLREAGIAEDDLQLLIIRDTIARADHAVLAVRVEQRWVVLDNRNFVLADLQSTLQIKRYRLLAQFGPDTDVSDLAGVVITTALEFLM